MRVHCAIFIFVGRLWNVSLVHDDKKVSRSTGVKRMTQIDLCAATRTFPFANQHVNIQLNLAYSIAEIVHRRKRVQIN